MRWILAAVLSVSLLAADKLSAIPNQLCGAWILQSMSNDGGKTFQYLQRGQNGLLANVTPSVVTTANGSALNVSVVSIYIKNKDRVSMISFSNSKTFYVLNESPALKQGTFFLQTAEELSDGTTRELARFSLKIEPNRVGVASPQTSVKTPPAQSMVFDNVVRLYRQHNPNGLDNEMVSGQTHKFFANNGNLMIAIITDNSGNVNFIGLALPKNGNNSIGMLGVREAFVAWAQVFDTSISQEAAKDNFNKLTDRMLANQNTQPSMRIGNATFSCAINGYAIIPNPPTVGQRPAVKVASDEVDEKNPKAAKFIEFANGFIDSIDSNPSTSTKNNENTIDYYNDYWIEYYISNEKKYWQNIEISSNSVALPLGIKIGMSKVDVIRIMGKSIEATNDKAVYSPQRLGDEVIFYFKAQVLQKVGLHVPDLDYD